jgi:ribonuclease J
MDPAKSLVVTTGSQGERAAALSRAAENDHPHLKIRKEDKVLHSARIIPGQEGRAYTMLNALAYQGCELVYGRNSGLHASGHACKDELKHLIQLVQPRSFIPVHGERTFLLEHAQLAKEAGVAEVLVMRNGERIGLSPKTSGAHLSRLEYEKPKRFYSTEAAIGDRETMHMGARKRLAWNGVIAVNIDLRKEGEKTKATARIQTKAVVEAVEDFEERLIQVAQNAASNVPKNTPDKEIEDAVRHSLRRLCKGLTGQKPTVLVFLNRPEKTA